MICEIMSILLDRETSETTEDNDEIIYIYIYIYILKSADRCVPSSRNTMLMYCFLYFLSKLRNDVMYVCPYLSTLFLW